MPDRETLEEREAQEWLRCATAGDFPAAWAISERSLPRRLALPQATLPRHLQTVWNGAPLDGGRVLIRCYHGLGDTIQFIRYASLVKTLAREVTVWAQPPLLPLLRTVESIDRLLPLHDGVPDVDYDVDVEVMELPFVFRTTVPTIPARVPYLAVDAAGGEAGGARRVGIAWRGGAWDQRRAVPFALLDRLLTIPGVRWYTLQIDRGPDERHDNLREAPVSTVPDTARVIKGLDLVISIDSLFAHLAGALAVPVWTLLPYEADWRWMRHREDSPWYPTMRLFRQARPGEWDRVIERVREELFAAPAAR